MEIGRVEWCRGVGFEYRGMESEDGVLLAVAEATCRYQSPARYDEEVIVATRVKRAHARLVAFAYDMRGAAANRAIAAGSTTHLFCGPDLNPSRLPEKYWEMVGIPPRCSLLLREHRPQPNERTL